MEADQREVQRDLCDGGIRGLVAFATDRWPAIEADFQRVYTLDARVQRRNVRRFKALLDGLPYDTALVWATERSERRERDGGWSFAEHLAVMNVEMLHAVFRAVLSTKVYPHGTRPPPLPKPLHIPRPGETRKGPRRVNPFELIQAMKAVTSG